MKGGAKSLPGDQETNHAVLRRKRHPAVRKSTAIDGLRTCGWVNSSMPGRCSSALRCSSILCEACCWRYSLRIARRIQAHDPRQLHSLQITCSIAAASAFSQLRRSLHNSFGYRRRHSRWWRSVGLWAWWTGSGLHGLVELGSITGTEFASALRHHGDVRLRPIAIETVRTEVYRAGRSISTSLRDAGGRYQPLKIAIEPVMMAASALPIVGSRMIPPMPMIV